MTKSLNNTGKKSRKAWALPIGAGLVLALALGASGAMAQSSVTSAATNAAKNALTSGLSAWDSMYVRPKTGGGIPVYDSATQMSIASTNSRIIDLLSQLNAGFSSLSSAITGSAAGQDKAGTIKAQATNNQIYTTNKAALQANLAIDKSTTEESKSALCTQLVAAQGTAIAEAVSNAIAGFLRTTPYFNNVCRGPLAGHSASANCSGPQGVKEFLETQCKLKTAREMDQPDKKCISKNTSMQGADRDAVQAIFGGKRLMFTGPNTTVSDGGSTRGEAAYRDNFLVALNACYNLGGLPGSHPVGGGSPQALFAAVTAGTNETFNKGLMGECFDHLARHSIIDKDTKDSALKAAWQASVDQCKSMVGASKGKISGDKYDNCELGASQNDLEEMASLYCSTQYNVGAGAAAPKTTMPNLRLEAQLCLANRLAYLQSLRNRRDTFSGHIALKK